MTKQIPTAAMSTASVLAIAAAGWYAIGLPSTSANQLPLKQPGITPDVSESSQSTRPLDRSAFDVVLWHAPPPPPAPVEKSKTVVAVTPPPPVDLLAITRTDSGYEAIFYNKQADRLLNVIEGGELGSYHVSGVGATWVRLDHNGRTTTLRLDQPRIAAREGEVADE